MTTLDFLPSDPALVDRIRQGLHAHKAQTGLRERLADATMAEAAAGESQPPARPPSLPLSPRRADG